MSYNKFILFSLTVTALSGSISLHAQNKKVTTTAPNKKESAEAKDTLIKEQHINIYQNYKPEIPTPVKPIFDPSTPNIESVKAQQTYTVPEWPVTINYLGVPIKPLALGKNSVALPFQNYAKVGYGNLHSLYLDAGIGGLHKPNLLTAFHVHHFSQSAALDNQKQSKSSVEGTLEYITPTHVIDAAVNVNRYVYHQYGYDHSLYDFTNDQTKLTYWGMGVSVGARNRAAWHNLWYHPTIGFNTFHLQDGASENRIDVNVPAQYQLDSTLTVKVGVKANLDFIKNGDINNAHSHVFQVTPALEVHLPNAGLLNLGLNPTWGNGGTAYLLPDIYFKQPLSGNKFSLIAGWVSELSQNSVEQLADRNPFADSYNYGIQMRKDQAYVGFNTSLGDHLSIYTKGGFRQWKHMPVYLNNYYLNNQVGNIFSVAFEDKVQSVFIDGGLDYKIDDNFNIGGGINWNNFSKKQSAKLWQIPTMKINGHINWTPMPKLNIGVNADFWNRRFAQNKDFEIVTLKSFVDIGAQAEYQIVPRLSIWAQANNIFNNHYQLYYQYPVYGINIIGGIRFKF